MNNNQLRALIFHPALTPYRLDLFNDLSKRCQLHLIFLDQDAILQKFDQSQLRKKLQSNHEYLTYAFSFMKRRLSFSVWSKINRFKPNVVVTSEFSPTSIITAANRLSSGNKFGHVVWTDDNPESVLADSLIRRLFRRLILPLVSGMVVLSEEAAQLYRGRYNARCPMGISPILNNEMVFRKALAQAEETAKSTAALNDLEGKRLLLFVGRLAPSKRIDRIIQAFATIQQSATDVVLALVGDGPERNALQDLAQRLGVSHKIIFAGRLEEDALYAWYLLGSIFVFTPEQETFGAVVNEALLAGMPVICSSRAGARTIIRDGINGAVVNPEDSAAIQATIFEYLSKTPPISVGRQVGLKPSLMGIHFAEAVENFISLLETVSKKTIKAL